MEATAWPRGWSMYVAETPERRRPTLVSRTALRGTESASPRATVTMEEGKYTNVICCAAKLCTICVCTNVYLSFYYTHNPGMSSVKLSGQATLQLQGRLFKNKLDWPLPR